MYMRRPACPGVFAGGVASSGAFTTRTLGKSASVFSWVATDAVSAAPAIFAPDKAAIAARYNGPHGYVMRRFERFLIQPPPASVECATGCAPSPALHTTIILPLPASDANVSNPSSGNSQHPDKRPTATYHPMSWSSGKVRSAGGTKECNRSPLIFGSINRLGKAMVSKWLTENPAWTGSGVYSSARPIGSAPTNWLPLTPRLAITPDAVRERRASAVFSVAPSA